MPIRNPVVNGTPCLPASSMVRSRLAGSLSERCRALHPGASRPAFIVSSISPMLGDTAPVGRSIPRSESGIRMWQQGRLAQNQFAHRFQIMKRRLITQMTQCSRISGNSSSGLSPRLKRASVQPSCSPPGDRQNFVRSHGVRAGVIRIATKRAVSAIVATKIGQREGKPCANR